MPRGDSGDRSGSRSPSGSRGSGATRALILAGVVPLPWFLAFATAAGLVQPGYEAVSQHVSVLTTEPGLPSTLANLAAFGSGLAFVLFGIGLWGHTRRKVSFGSLCWIVFGLSMISNGL